MVNFKHGMQGSRTYYTWAAMKSRCLNPDHEFYFRYGGRGITICDRWLKFENFLADMGEVPEGLTLERIKNDLGYFPGNCQWVTQKAQCRNRSSTRLLTHNAKTLCLQEWAELKGLNKRTLRERLTRGWSVADAIDTPLESKYSKGKKK